jgi:hypothetical protein
VFAGVRRLVALPHLVGDLQGFLQLLETLGGGGEGYAQAAALLLVPAGADAQRGAAAGQHVQGGDDLEQQSRMPVVHPGDLRAEPDFRGDAGQEGERRVTLQHLVLRRADVLDLEEVVHHPQRVEPRVVGGLRHCGELRAEMGGSGRPTEVADCQANLHRISL